MGGNPVFSAGETSYKRRARTGGKFASSRPPSGQGHVRLDKHPRIVKKTASVMTHWPPPLIQKKGASQVEETDALWLAEMLRSGILPTGYIVTAIGIAVSARRRWAAPSVTVFIASSPA